MRGRVFLGQQGNFAVVVVEAGVAVGLVSSVVVVVAAAEVFKKKNREIESFKKIREIEIFLDYYLLLLLMYLMLWLWLSLLKLWLILL